MNSIFFRLGRKKFFRSPYWKKSIAANILLGFFALYMLVALLALGLGLYVILKKTSPEEDPFMMLNGFIVTALMGDLVLRYMLQKLPTIHAKELLLLPISKKRIISYTLNKSLTAFFNWAPLFFLIPFSIMAVIDGDLSPLNILLWSTSVWLLFMSNHFLNMLAEESKTFFGIILGVFVVFVGNRYFGWISIDQVFGDVIYHLYTHPYLVLIPLLYFFFLYKQSFKMIAQTMFLDHSAMQEKSKDRESANLSFVNRLGSVAPFLKNDMRMIWRNKRPKQTFFTGFFFLLYALIFFLQDAYADNYFFLTFAAIFTTGGFAISFGQLIPAWDADYYTFWMTQKTSYQDYLNSKYFLMVIMTVILAVLAQPYMLMGMKFYGFIMAAAVYNAGFNSLLLIFAGAFIKKPIKLNESGFGNTKGTSATTFIMVIPLLVIPGLTVMICEKYLGLEWGLASLAVAGALGFVLKPILFPSIVRLYKKRKYKTIEAFVHD